MKITTYIASFFFAGILHLAVSCQSDSVAKNIEPKEDLIETILRNYSTEFINILTNTKKYEVQIIYTQINRDKNNVPSFRQYSYGLDSRKYFYPASLVKLPCSALALEKLNKLNIEELDKNTCMQTDSASVCQKKIRRDTSALNAIPSVAQYIKRMLLVSDNDAYGRIYEFLGQGYINEELKKKGYPDIRIVHRFDIGCGTAQNRCTNPISFYNSLGKCIYQQPLQTNKMELSNPLGTVKKGKGYIDKNEKLVNEPKDYTFMNYLSLQDIHDILKSIIFPEQTEKAKRFDFKKEDYAFLYKYMSMYPRESDYPKYNVKDFEDGYKKYFIYGTNHKKIEEDSVRIFNIVGQSYGNLSDVAYIINYDKKIEFMLSAVIYVNEDEIINDGKYEYKTIGFPFLSTLGKAIYGYESQRKKDYLPDLSTFKLR